jgi:hypothetical protein
LSRLEFTFSYPNYHYPVSPHTFPIHTKKVAGKVAGERGKERYNVPVYEHDKIQDTVGEKDKKKMQSYCKTHAHNIKGNRG